MSVMTWPPKKILGAMYLTRAHHSRFRQREAPDTIV